MAYSSSPSTVSGGAELWETDLDEVFVFRGDYREHMHLEDPTKPLYNGQLSLPSLPVLRTAATAPPASSEASVEASFEAAWRLGDWRWQPQRVSQRRALAWVLRQAGSN